MNRSLRFLPFPSSLTPVFFATAKTRYRNSRTVSAVRVKHAWKSRLIAIRPLCRLPCLTRNRLVIVASAKGLARTLDFRFKEARRFRFKARSDGVFFSDSIRFEFPVSRQMTRMYLSLTLVTIKFLRHISFIPFKDWLLKLKLSLNFTLNKVEQITHLTLKNSIYVIKLSFSQYRVIYWNHSHLIYLLLNLLYLNYKICQILSCYWELLNFLNRSWHVNVQIWHLLIKTVFIKQPRLVFNWTDS